MSGMTPTPTNSVPSGMVSRFDVMPTQAPPGILTASGWPVLDELLGGGWPRAALAEVLSDAHQGLSLLLPAMAGLSGDARWITWVAPPYVPYAPALAARGIRVDRLLLIRDLHDAARGEDPR